MIILKYVGEGSFLPGVPDRDLSKEDVENTGMKIPDLIHTGLYAPIEDKMEQPKPSNKAIIKNYPNKKESE